jgi:CRP-like cAMP-binding protein
MNKMRCFDCPLRTKPAFKPKSLEEVAIINEMKRDHITFPTGAEIIHPGQEGTEMFTLFSGWAFRYKTLPDGRRQILNFLLPGDLIGLQAAMFAAAQHGVEALTDVELCLLPRNRVWDLFGRLPELAFEVTWLGALEGSMVDENLLTAGRRSALERVATLIVTLYKRANALDLVQDHTFEFPLSQQHIADALGLSLVHTNKTLAKLRRLGLFTRTNGHLTLANPHVLERVAQYFDEDVAPRPMI